MIIIALLLSKHNKVGELMFLERVKSINSGVSPIKDEQITTHLNDKKFNFSATTDLERAIDNASYVE